MADFYELLGVSREATASEIRSAFMRLAREHHPDRFSVPEEKRQAQEHFKDLTAAFNTLSDAAARSQYDAEQARPKAVSPAEVAALAYEQGLKLYAAQAFGDALEQLRIAVYHAPEQAGYQAAYGRVLARFPERAREAAEAFEQAIRLDARNAGYHAELAELLVGQGLRLRAQKLAAAARQLATNDPAVRERLARVERLCAAPPPARGGRPPAGSGPKP